MGWEALPRELKSVPPFLNNGPGPSLALLHPAPPRLPPPLVGRWGHLSWKPRSRGGRGQRRPTADKVPSFWAPLAAQAPGRPAFLRAWEGAGGLSHSPCSSTCVFLLQGTKARHPYSLSFVLILAISFPSPLPTPRHGQSGQRFPPQTTSWQEN